MKKLILLISIMLLSFVVESAPKIITFTPSAPTTSVQPFTCGVTQDVYAFTASMYGPCTTQNLFPTYGSLTAGKVGTFSAYSMIAPISVTFSLKGFNLKYVVTPKGYPAVYLNVVDATGAYTSYNLKANPLGAYDVSALPLNNLVEVYIQARTASRLELTNISIIDSL